MSCHIVRGELASSFFCDRVLCTFRKIPAAAGIARSSQLSSSSPGQAVQYDLAGGTARPSQYSPSISLQLVRAGRRFGSAIYGLRALWNDDRFRKDMHYGFRGRSHMCILLCGNYSALYWVLCTACAPGEEDTLC